MPRPPEKAGSPADTPGSQRSTTLTKAQIETTVTRLVDARQRKARVEGWLAAGPVVCGPGCEWCYSGNWLGGSAVRRWRRSS
jgi:hypothetical protein